MSQRSSHPDDPPGAKQATEAFASMSAAGMDMFQEWLKAASSAMPPLAGAAGAMSGSGTPHAMGNMGAWSMPTMDPDELDKRIQDLRTVQFWLEQNARMIAMTIQGLEVQKMTLSTLQGMNVSMDALRDALKARPAAAPSPVAPATGPEPAATTDTGAGTESDTAGQGDLINPMRWWDTLTQQFTHLAAQATKAPQVAPAPKPAGRRRTAAASPRDPVSGKASGKPATKNAPGGATQPAPRRRKPGGHTPD